MERQPDESLTAACIMPRPRPVDAREDAEIFVWAADAERRAHECGRTHAKLVEWLLQGNLAPRVAPTK